MRNPFFLISTIKHTLKVRLDRYIHKRQRSSFSQLLVDTRTAQKLNQFQAGQKVGVGEEAWGQWECGKSSPVPSQITANLVNFLGCNPMPKSTYSERLYALRFEKGWRMSDAAKVARVCLITWWKWETKQTVVLHRLFPTSLAFFKKYNLIPENQQ
jgi:transcriptional regulator with XRE-family HTH domain